MDGRETDRNKWRKLVTTRLELEEHHGQERRAIAEHSSGALGFNE